MHNDSGDNLENQQSPQGGNSEVTEVEALRRELLELKEEIKNKQQFTSHNIAEGIAGGFIKIIFIIFLLNLGVMSIGLLVGAITSNGENELDKPSVTSPSAK